jgi:predicted RNase H-like nuclease (RuvC/YqgF family)
MSYSQYPSATPQPQKDTPTTNTPTPPKKDNRVLIYILLGGALVATWAYILFMKSETGKERVQYVDRIIKDSMSQAELQVKFDALSGRADSITNNNQQLQGALAEKKTEIDKLKASISKTLKDKNATKAQLAEAQKQIVELQSKIESLFADIEKLNAENKQLTATNEQLSTDKKQLTEEKGALQTDLDKTKEEKAKVEDLASTLHASNINITAIQLKGSKEKETSTAKRADYFKVTFDLDENRVTPSGSKSLLVCIYHPDGSLSVSSGTFTDRDGKTKPYTSKVDVSYEQGKRQQVSFDWKPGSKFETGDYKVEIYQNGFKIGEGIKTLKKATFLGL